MNHIFPSLDKDLVKAPIENLLHFLLVKGDFLQISLVVVIEIGQGFLTGYGENRTNNSLELKEKWILSI